MVVQLFRVLMTDTYTKGYLAVDGERICATLEPPWVENERYKSCILDGQYNAILGDDTRPDSACRGLRVYRLNDANGRSGIMIAGGRNGDRSTVEDTQGIILVGTEIKDDGKIVGSREALNKIYEATGRAQSFTLDIRNVATILICDDLDCVSVTSSDWALPKLLMKSERQAGYESNGNIARDMHFGFWDKCKGHLHTDTKFSTDVDGFTRELNDLINEDLRESRYRAPQNNDPLLWARFEELVKWTSENWFRSTKLQSANLGLLKNMNGRKPNQEWMVLLSELADDLKPSVVGARKETAKARVKMQYSRMLSNDEPHSDPNITMAVFNHRSTISFIGKAVAEIIDTIVEKRGNINNIDNTVKLLDRDEKEVRPRYSDRSDLFEGLKIAINDTWGYRITLEKYERYEYRNNSRLRGELSVKIFDHFGLDADDIRKFGTVNGIRANVIVPRRLPDTILEVGAKGFRAWFILQHYYGYRPFVNIMERKIAFDASMDCEKTDPLKLEFPQSELRTAYHFQPRKKLWWMI